MIATFSNGIKGKEVDVLRARTANRTFFPTPGSLGPDKNPMTGGATMGAAPDGRELPQWVEFEWQVCAHYGRRYHLSVPHPAGCEEKVAKSSLRLSI